MVPTFHWIGEDILHYPWPWMKESWREPSPWADLPTENLHRGHPRLSGFRQCTVPTKPLFQTCLSPHETPSPDVPLAWLGEKLTSIFPQSTCPIHSSGSQSHDSSIFYLFSGLSHGNLKGPLTNLAGFQNIKDLFKPEKNQDQVRRASS